MSRRFLKGTSGVMAAVLTMALCACGSTADNTNTQPVSDSAAASTTQTQSAAGTTEIGFAWWGNQVRNENTQKGVDLYNEQNPDVKVNTQFFSWADYWDKLATSAAGQKLPDVVQMDYSYIKQYSDKEQLLDLTPYIESGALDVSNIDDTVLQMGKIGDGTYGIAAGVNAMAMFYNKTVLDEAGITIKDNMTLDEFIEVAKEVTEKTGYRANLIDTYSNYMEPFARANDIFVKGQQLGGSSAADYLPYFQVEKQGIDEGWQLPPDISGQNTALEQDPMVYGSSPETMAWCKSNGSNTLGAYQNAAPEGVEIGITTIPTSDPKKSNYLKPSMLFSISANTANPDEAVAFLNFLINSQDFYDIMLADRGIPSNQEISKTIMPKLGEQDQKATVYVNDVVTPNCSPIGAPTEDGYTEQLDMLRGLDEQVQYGEITPEDAAEQYFTKATEIFNEAAKKAANN